MKSICFLPTLLLCAACIPLPSAGPSPAHPRLVMTLADVQSAQTQQTPPLFAASLAAARNEVDAEIAVGIKTPQPRDYSGGYTHRRHKRNYVTAHKAAALYQFLGDERYAVYVRDLLLQYAAMYRDLPLHPKPRSYARGKLFWQCLNDANWLVFMSQAYDAIHDFLTEDERQTLEHQLFRPFADHISVNSPQFFNRIHNHSTWGTAAVGMVGLVLDDETLIQRALHGLRVDNVGEARDNDGGFIRQAGQKAGFLANLDNAFSPDGYYTEGPYYQRYAMYPFLVFAQSLRNAGHKEQVFERNDGVLIRAVETLIQLSDKNGELFPLNDAQKGMSLRTDALVTAIDIAFQVSGNRRLLSIAEMQNRVLLDGAGFAVASAIARKEALPFRKKTLLLGDGRSGAEGGLAILRAPDEALTLVFKYTAQGLSHGHYDKLSFCLFRHGSEVLQDYGMVRFVNIGQKGGGNYLPENTTWAKQSIAHNTLVVNQTSHFEGRYELGSRHHSELVYFNAEGDTMQVVSAAENNAYSEAKMRRTMALLQLPGADVPAVLDIVEVQSGNKNRYDLPFHYRGQIIDTNFKYVSSNRSAALGDANGYQHLYAEARSHPGERPSTFSWILNRQFYTLTSATEAEDELILARLGANDPNFNLRRDPVFLIRREARGDAIFINVIEPHGRYSPITELAVDAVSNIERLSVLRRDARYIVVGIETRSGGEARFYWARDAQAGQPHRIEAEGKTVTWVGPVLYTTTKLGD